MYHIKRDGGYLCGAESKWKNGTNKSAFITFSQAHKRQLTGCCQACMGKYFEKLSKISDTVVCMNMPNPKYRKKDKPITKTIVISNSLAGLQ